MKQLREDGKRLKVIKNPNPKGPDVQMWCPNHEHCLFCQHCDSGLQIENQSKINITAFCKLPTVSSQGNNCLLHNLNENHTCPSFKDVDEGQPAVVAIKKKKPAAPEMPTFHISEKGVEQK